jgi:hypothetical protein
MAVDYEGDSPRATAVSLSIQLAVQEDTGTAADCRQGAAAAAVLRTLRCRVPGLRAVEAAITPGIGLVDDAAWCALHQADAIVLDLQLPEGDGSCVEQEQAVAAARRELAAAGLLPLLWQRAWLGCHIVAVGPACALLGADSHAGGAEDGSAPPVLPWYMIRAGGGEARGWGGLHSAVAAAPAGALGVGILESSACVVDPVRGCAELVVAPRKEALVAAARWGVAHGPEASGLDPGEDWGFSCACRK